MDHLKAHHLGATGSFKLDIAVSVGEDTVFSGFVIYVKVGIRAHWAILFEP